MRNLKRALSLALASVMLLGMMVVGTSASYPDVKATDNEEAIAVMQLLKIMEGDDKGNFNPAKAVTRNEMAVIMTKLLDLNTKDYAGSCPFTDVPAWAEPYVAACYANKIVSGTSATTYGGDQTVTTAQAALMVLKALGYFQYAADFGEDWMVSTVKQASKISLFDGLTSNANAALTRNDVAQLALNALEADVVETDGNGGTTIKGDGFEISTGAAKYDKVEKKGFDYQGRSDADDGYQQLVEKLFGKDVVKTTDKDGAKDDFGRPATKWENKDKDVKDSITVANEAVEVYASADFDKDTIKDLKDDYKDGITKILYNGETVANVNETYLKASHKGLTVEIYEDPTNDDGLIAVVTEAYAAVLNDIKTDDDDKVTEVTVDVYEASKGGRAKSLTIDVDDDEDAYDVVKGYKEDDVFALYLKPGWDADGANMDKVVLAAEDVETVDGKVTATSITGSYNGWVKIDGTKYDFAWEYSQIPVAKNSEGTFYLHNGYILHFDEDANKSDDEYLYVVRSYNEADKWNKTDLTYYAEVVFTDGTAKTVELADVADSIVTSEKKIKNDVYSYEYDKDDDTYKLTAVKDAKHANGTVDIDKGKTAVMSGVTANSKTVYINVELDGGKFDKSAVYTGYKSVASFDSATGYIVKDGSVAEYVFIVNGEATASSSDLMFVAYESKSDRIDDKDLKAYYTFNAVVDGKIVEIMVKDDTDAAAQVTADNQMFKSAVQNSDDVYTKLTVGTDFKTKTGDFSKAKNEVIKIANEAYAYTDDVVVYVVDTDGDITTGSINRNYSASSDYTIKVLFTQNDDDEVTALYIVKTAK